MNIVIHVSNAQLRGMTFTKYTEKLESLVIEMFPTEVESVDITQARRVRVLVDGKTDTDAAKDIRGLADNLTDPEVIDSWFG